MSALRTFSIAPSDFRWLLDRCPRCWWQKIHSLAPPKDVLPAIFNRIDHGMKEFLSVANLRAMGIPAKAELNVGKLLSSRIEYPEHGVALVLSGYLDRAFELEDGTFAIAECKATKADPQKLIPYERQVHGYQSTLR